MAGRKQLISTGALLALLLFMSFFDNFTQIPMIAPYASGLGANAVMTGWIVGIYSLTNSLGNIGAGIILDKFGRRIPLAIGLAWAGLGVWLYGFVGTPLGLLGARAFHGLGGSILVPAIFTMAADTLPSGKRGQGMGRIGAVIGLAAIIGPMVSGILRQAWGPRAVFTTVFVVMALGGLLALTLPETLSRNERDEKKKTEGVRIPFTAAPFQIASAAGFGIAFGLGALTFMLPLQMERAGMAAARSGSVFSFFAVVAVLLMLTIGRRGSRRTTLALGFLAIAASFAIFSLGSSFEVVSLGMAVFGIGFGMTYPTLNTQVAAMYPVQERGRAYGIFYAFYTLGVVIAPPLIGWLTEFTSTTFIFGAFAAVSLAASLFLYFFRHLMDVEPQQEPVQPAAV